MITRQSFHLMLMSSLAGLLLLCCMSTFAHAESFLNESPAVEPILARGMAMEQHSDAIDAEWQAAAAYCEASRLGSTEAQYRLGMLYAFGRGVPESRALAASLFSQAGSQGHVEAQNMLETIALQTTALPACVTSLVLPEKNARLTLALDASIEKRLSRLPQSKHWLVKLVDTLAGWYAVDSRLVLSIIAVESDFNPSATSNQAAMGLMQLIPDTAERFNIKNAYDATQNIKGGMAYIRWLLAHYEGDVALSLAAYNAGEGAVNRHKGVPPYPETQQYVKRVMALYQRKHHPYDPAIAKPSPILRRG